MQKGTPSIYEIKEVIDSIITRTIHVRNEIAGSNQPVVTWVCFLEPETSHEAELVLHLPKWTQLSVSLSDIIYDEELSLCLPTVYKRKPVELKPSLAAKLTRDLEEELASFQTLKSAVSDLLTQGSAFELGGVLDESELPPPQLVGAKLMETLANSTIVLGAQLNMQTGSETPKVFPTTLRGKVYGRPKGPSDNFQKGFSPPVTKQQLDPLQTTQFDLNGDEGREELLQKRLNSIKQFNRLPGTPLKVGEVHIKATLEDGTSIPKLKGTPVEVPELFVQILFGIRAMILVLIDASGLLCHKHDGQPDPDYIGELSANCVYNAIDKMATWKLEGFVPNCKYWKDYPLASCLNNPLPAVPASWPHAPEDTLFGGPLGTFWRRLTQPLTNHPDSPGGPIKPPTVVHYLKKSFRPPTQTLP